MKMVTKYIGLLLCAIALYSCAERSGSMDVNDFMRYVESSSSGYRKDINAGDMSVNIQYKPIEYVVYKEMARSAIDIDSFEARCLELQHTIWFNIGLHIKDAQVNPIKNNVSGIQEYNSRYQYFLTEASKDIKAYYGSDENEIEKIAYHFETNYGLTPMDVIVVGFKIPDSIAKEDIVLVYHDKLYNSGLVKAKISKENLQNQPQLVL